MVGLFKRSLRQTRSRRAKAAQPLLEGLEDRKLLYAATGDVWAYSSLVTYSLMPDGTSINGTPSSLYSTMNSYMSTATWQTDLQAAAASWENAANVNLAQVSDDGSPLNSGNYQQGAPNFGDIRIGAMPLASGVLAETIMPPQATAGSAAGDIIFNSNVNWSSSTGYDLLTVALHEFGHTMSLGESSVTSAVMYQYYSGVRQVLTSDDVSGVVSAYSTRPTLSNTTYQTATPITFNGSNQATVTGLQLPSASSSAWFSFVVPSGTSGTLTMTMQSSNLSSLEPRLTLYNSSLRGLAAAYSSSYGGTVTISVSGVTAGQTYYLRATPNTSGAGSAGAFGLTVNAGTGTMSPIAPPNTSVIATGGTDGTMLDENTKGSLSSSSTHGHGGTKLEHLRHSGNALMVNVRLLRHGHGHH